MHDGTPHSRSEHCPRPARHAPGLVCAQDHPQGPVGTSAAPADYYHEIPLAFSEMPRATLQLFPDSRPLPIG